MAIEEGKKKRKKLKKVSASYACQAFVPLAEDIGLRCREREDGFQAFNRFCAGHRFRSDVMIAPRSPVVLVRFILSEAMDGKARDNEIPFVKDLGPAMRNKSYAAIAEKLGIEFFRSLKNGQVGGNGCLVYEPKLEFVSLTAIPEELLAAGYHLTALYRRPRFVKGQPVVGSNLTAAFTTESEMAAQEGGPLEPLVLSGKQAWFLRHCFRDLVWDCELFDNPPNEEGDRKMVFACVAGRDQPKRCSLHWNDGLLSAISPDGEPICSAAA